MNTSAVPCRQLTFLGTLWKLFYNFLHFTAFLRDPTLICLLTHESSRWSFQHAYVSRQQRVCFWERTLASDGQDGFKVLFSHMYKHNLQDLYVFIFIGHILIKNELLLVAVSLWSHGKMKENGRGIFYTSRAPGQSVVVNEGL